MEENINYLELLDNSFVAFHLYSLNMKKITLLNYKLQTVYEYDEKKEVLEELKKYSPKYEEDENFKEKYEKLIEPITTYFAIFLKFDYKKYFSLLGINYKKARKIKPEDWFEFLYPFQLDMKFSMINEKDEESEHEITIIFGGFTRDRLLVRSSKSETLCLVGEAGENYAGRKEIKFKDK